MKTVINAEHSLHLYLYVEHSSIARAKRHGGSNMKRLLVFLIILAATAETALAAPMRSADFTGNSDFETGGYQSYDWGLSAFYLQGSTRPGNGFGGTSAGQGKPLFGGYGFDLDVSRRRNPLLFDEGAYSDGGPNAGPKAALRGTSANAPRRTLRSPINSPFSAEFSGLGALGRSGGGRGSGASGGGASNSDGGGMGIELPGTQAFPQTEVPIVPNPEPSTMALLLAGLAGLAGIGFLRRGRG
jgi:hypothetical protein